ncbi:hypothetical protein [Micromonospora sp. WMMD1082]|uniref:hypothetical protein n=1 Tax=Micromonospora sp. WMMD1082 TaxID=3016104 RepID=UPI002416DC18|nr:hypothetical protein [Micromonospora sp. WMMD1082]MDG4792737.1 hypothetical protein [Micromonospora sp. WMMD1082]
MNTTTAGKLTEGARAYAALTNAGPEFAKSTEGAQVVTVTAAPLKVGRRTRIETDRGVFEVGVTTKVILAPPAEPEHAADADPVPPPAGIVTASVDLDAAGRLTSTSVVAIGDRAIVVKPESAPDAPSRLRAALAELGYEPVGRWSVDAEGRAVCPVRPAHPQPAQ